MKLFLKSSEQAMLSHSTVVNVAEYSGTSASNTRSGIIMLTYPVTFPPLKKDKILVLHNSGHAGQCVCICGYMHVCLYL